MGHFPGWPNIETETNPEIGTERVRETRIEIRERGRHPLPISNWSTSWQTGIARISFLFFSSFFLDFSSFFSYLFLFWAAVARGMRSPLEYRGNLFVHPCIRKSSNLLEVSPNLPKASSSYLWARLKVPRDCSSFRPHWTEIQPPMELVSNLKRQSYRQLIYWVWSRSRGPLLCFHFSYNQTKQWHGKGIDILCLP